MNPNRIKGTPRQGAYPVPHVGYRLKISSSAPAPSATAPQNIGLDVSVRLDRSRVSMEVNGSTVGLPDVKSGVLEPSEMPAEAKMPLA